MGNKKIIIFLSIFLFLYSCAPVYWDIKKSFRKPGETFKEHPEKIWKEYQCSQKKLPYIEITKYEVLPPELLPGEEINQHFEYIMCPKFPAQVIQGVLYRRIYYKGQVIFEDITKDFEFKPGKWAVDAFITVPPSAPAGVYYLSMEFKSPKFKIKKGQDFVVKPKK